jgi:hypothetical protein
VKHESENASDKPLEGIQIELKASPQRPRHQQQKRRASRLALKIHLISERTKPSLSSIEPLGSRKGCCDCLRKSLIPWTAVADASPGQNDRVFDTCAAATPSFQLLPKQAA